MVNKYYSTKFNLFRSETINQIPFENFGGLRSNGFYKKNQSSSQLPLFSVITVVYNNVDRIKRCMNSVFNQSYQNIEYIIIDGASNDGTLELIKKEDEYIDLWISENDLGIYDAINKGINLAKGFTLMLHSDDKLNCEDTLKNISKYFINNHKLYFGKVENYNDLVKWTYPNVSSIDQNWFLTNNVPHQSTFIFHELHKNFLFTDHRLSIGNDALVLGKIAQNYETVFIDEVITKVELGGDSNNWKSLLRVYDYNYQTFIVNKELGRKTSYIALIYQNIRSSIQYFVFKYLGRKYFYKFFYRKYIKKND